MEIRNYTKYKTDDLSNLVLEIETCLNNLNVPANYRPKFIVFDTYWGDPKSKSQYGFLYVRFKHGGNEVRIIDPLKLSNSPVEMLASSGQERECPVDMKVEMVKQIIRIFGSTRETSVLHVARKCVVRYGDVPENKKPDSDKRKLRDVKLQRKYHEVLHKLKSASYELAYAKEEIPLLNKYMGENVLSESSIESIQIDLHIMCENIAKALENKLKEC